MNYKEWGIKPISQDAFSRKSTPKTTAYHFETGYEPYILGDDAYIAWEGIQLGIILRNNREAKEYQAFQNELSELQLQTGYFRLINGPKKLLKIENLEKFKRAVVHEGGKFGTYIDVANKRVITADTPKQSKARNYQ